MSVATRSAWRPLSLLGLLLLIGIAAWVLLDAEDPEAASSGAVDPGNQASASAKPLETLPESSEKEATRSDERSEPSTEPVESAIPSRPIQGRVITLAGEPLPRVSVASKGAPDTPLAQTASDGSFRCTVSLDDGQRLIVGTEGYVTFGEARVSSGISEYVIVAMPGVEVSGHVVDSGNQPIKGAELKVDIPNRFLRELPINDETQYVRLEVQSDAEGAFRLALVPTFAEGFLSARHPGYRTHTQPLPATIQRDLWIRLYRKDETAPGRGVQGIVVDTAGQGIAEATVQLGSEKTSTDEAGRFTIEGAEAGADLLAYKEGYAPAVREGFGDVVLASPGPLAPIELVLGQPAEIAGTLVDDQWRPLPGWKLLLADATFAEVRSEVRGGQLPVGYSGPTEPVSVEEIAAGEQGPRTSDEAGRFRFEGLDPGRTYRIRAWNPKTLRDEVSEPVPAGTSDYVFRLRPSLARKVHGVVVDRHELPIAGILIRLTMIERRSPSGGQWMYTGQQLTTGLDGRFELEGVPRNDLLLRFKGDGVHSKTIDLAGEDDGQHLEIMLTRIRRLRLISSRPNVTQFAAETVTGERLRMSARLDAGRSYAGERIQLQEGRSPIVELSDEAAFAILLRNGQEAQRIPIVWDPVPDAVTEVRD
ncbi:MAG: carboxypeptidase-like regulatory domain-containing protein [Planctomycetota bacterium]